MPDATKAAHYMQQLDDARCDENWDAVPELVRKVRKHAPNRSCLALTAEIEHAIAKANLKSSPTPAPAADGSSTTTASSSIPGLDANHHLPALLTAIDTENAFPEDRFQARVCAGWLLWVLREYSGALARLPRALADHGIEITSDPGTATHSSEWTKVCALKSAYLRANCLARDGQREGALLAFEGALPALGGVWTAGPAEARQQVRYWAELFLTEYCMLASQVLREGASSLREPDCLGCFRTWAKYWAGGKVGVPVTYPGGHGFRGSVPRRQVWAEYYFALSEILQRDLPFPTGFLLGGTEGSARSQLRAELKKAEAIYQALLFGETTFPRADEQRAEVENFVHRLMQNWAVLNGRGWKEHDLGAGGRDSLCHGTLDTLYGAAAKTYHSTAMLRHLFTVHLAVAEFDLAFMAFDSWLELVKKGKARVHKTGHSEPALDDDAVMFETISACIAALCRYGGREAAEKARRLAEELEHLIDKLESGDSDSTDSEYEVPPSILALAWQSIGLAHAQWARMTFESESRTSIQEKAIHCLRKSLSPEYGRSTDIRGVFALGVLYAEQRKLSSAIELVKAALLTDKSAQGNQELLLGPYSRERSLIPLWHLLALMLSARQEYFMAARACEGSIEQFKDPQVLFGTRHLNGAYRSEHLNEAGIKDEKAGGNGLVDEMDDHEKESILQIKMTQLAILELVEGPAVAVNASTELLTLFPRLFGDVEAKLELSSRAEPPKSSAATLRSLRGSMFGGRTEKASRPRQSVVTTTTNNNPDADQNEKLTIIPSRPQTMQTVQSVATTAYTLQSANDPSAAATVDPSGRRSTNPESIKRRSRNSLRKRDRSGSRQRASFSATGEPPVPPLDGDKYFSAFLNAQAAGGGDAARSPSRSRAVSAAATTGGQDVGAICTPPLLPFVQFSQEHNRRRRKAVLVKVWLVIAGFYRRAGLLEDAHKAIGEAQKVALNLEADVIGDASALMSVRQAGWGMEKCVDEILADVWAEMGNLSLAREKPYQARADFETALTHFADHSGAIIGLSTILLDIYTEKLLPPPAVPGLDLRALSITEQSAFAPTTTGLDATTSLIVRNKEDKFPPLPSAPLGLGPTKPKSKTPSSTATTNGEAKTNGQPPSTDQHNPPTSSSGLLGPQLPPPHRATSLPLNDRLAARDRAYGLLSELTKLGSGWNDSEAWFVLARAYEESGQVEKARDALWWCVELEDGRGVRGWEVVGAGGGYVL